MLDAFLSEALARVDRRLVQVCDEEERRARLLVGDGSSGQRRARRGWRLGGRLDRGMGNLLAVPFIFEQRRPGSIPVAL